MAKKKKSASIKPMQQHATAKAVFVRPHFKVRMNSAFVFLAVLIPLLIYIPTLSSAVLLEDDGLFLAAGEHLGIAHPPGYPFYIGLLWVFMKLPFATPALAGHTLSAVIGALGCGALYLCGRLLGLSVILSFGAALLFGVQEHVWSQAIRAEVYSLNYFLTFATLALILQVRKTPQIQGYWMLGGVLSGLAIFRGSLDQFYGAD